jgi:hypothetical protein
VRYPAFILDPAKITAAPVDNSGFAERVEDLLPDRAFGQG